MYRRIPQTRGWGWAANLHLPFFCGFPHLKWESMTWEHILFTKTMILAKFWVGSAYTWFIFERYRDYSCTVQAIKPVILATQTVDLTDTRWRHFGFKNLKKKSALISIEHNTSHASNHNHDHSTIELGNDDLQHHEPYSHTRISSLFAYHCTV